MIQVLTNTSSLLPINTKSSLHDISGGHNHVLIPDCIYENISRIQLVIRTYSVLAVLKQQYGKPK